LPDYVLKDIHKSYGSLEVLKGVHMTIPEGTVASIIGPSGCGKTTLLRIVSGMLKQDSGSVTGFEGKTLSCVFQEPRLLEWMNVYKNVEWVLRDIIGDPAKRRDIIDKYLDIAGLSEYRGFYPCSLSGGMTQRTAIARAFAYPSKLLLMDEPFKSIDFERKSKMMDSVRKLWEIDHRTVFFVTHDIQEAAMLGDIIFMLTEKPSRVGRVIHNKLDYSERSIVHPYIMELQKLIYAEMPFNARS